MSLMWARRSNTISSGNMWHFSFDETSSVCKDGIRENGKLKLFNDYSIRIDARHYMHRGIWEEDGIRSSDLTEQQGIMELGIIKSERLEVELLSYAVINRPLEPSLPQQMEDYRRNAPDGKLEISKVEFVPLINSINRYTGRLLTPEANHLSMRLNSLFNNFSNERRNKEKGISKNVKFGSNIKIGQSCLIEDLCEIGNDCVIGDQCRIHRNVFIDDGVVIGNRVKIQNNNSIYAGVELEDGVFVGTNVSFTNDRYPRAIRKDNNMPVTRKDWKMEKTKVCHGASIGSGAVIRCGVTIGEWAMVGCGAVVVDDVKPGITVAGNPAVPIK
jgi:acetyltransferase-like isoleucine patch superfamily enzyme